MSASLKYDAWTAFTYRIERHRDPYSGQLEYALFVTRHEGPRLFDFSTVHFSTAKSRATLRRRVERLYPLAKDIGL